MGRWGFVMLIAIGVLGLAAVPADAHSGGTGSCGGHVDHSSGQYHHHDDAKKAACDGVQAG